MAVNILLALTSLFVAISTIESSESFVSHDEFNKLSHRVSALEKQNDDLQRENENLWNSLFKLSNHGKKSEQYESSAYGCNLDVITLSCDNATTINITSAYYGQYNSGCSGCCPPEEQDCVESMVDNRIGDWLELKYTCDGETQCDYENKGTTLGNCTAPYFAHYLIIYYQCLADIPDTSGPIAFTAYLVGGGNYGNRDVVIFNMIATNIGNGYDSASGYFTCPVHGVYVFSVSSSKLGDSGGSGIHLVHEESEIVTAYTGIGSDYDQGTTTGVVECNVGERVWAQSAYSLSQIDGTDGTRSTSFSGFLLHSY